MAVTKELFGKLKDGSEVYKFSIENKNGIKAVVTNLGAILVNLYVPDKKGKIADVVIGYDKLHMYVMNSCFFGCTVGPIANRIGKAQYKLDGKTVKPDGDLVLFEGDRVLVYTKESIRKYTQEPLF